VGTYGAIYDENLCPKRLLPYRGKNTQGSPETNPDAPLKAGVMTHDIQGNVCWSDGPCTMPEESIVRVSTDEQAADLANYVPFLTGKAEDGCDRRITGSPDLLSGRWKKVWVASMQGWTTMPDPDIDFGELCTELTADFIIDPDNTGGYLLQVESTNMMAVGVSLAIVGSEVRVTEIVSETVVRVVNVNPPAAPAVIQAGTMICVIGFRPCPVTEEAFADEVAACKDNSVVSFTKPADVAGMKVPGLIWRDQLGRWSFIPAPVDPTTGIVLAGRHLATPDVPVAAAANLPVFKSLPRTHFITPVVIFTQTSSGAAINEIKTVTLSGTTGYVAGATAVILAINMWGIQGGVTSGSHTYLKINDVIRAHVVLSINLASDADNSQITIALPADTNIKIEVSVTTPTPVGAGFQASVSVEGYIAP